MLKELSNLTICSTFMDRIFVFKICDLPKMEDALEKT